MYILDFPYVVGFGRFEYDILIKMLKNETDLTEEEEGRVDQMLQTAVRMKKKKTSRGRPRHHDGRSDCHHRQAPDDAPDNHEQNEYDHQPEFGVHAS